MIQPEVYKRGLKQIQEREEARQEALRRSALLREAREQQKQMEEEMLRAEQQEKPELKVPRPRPKSTSHSRSQSRSVDPQFIPHRINRRLEGNIDDREHDYQEILKDVDKHKPELQKVLQIFQSDKYEFGKKIDDYDMTELESEKRAVKKKREKTMAKVMR